MVELVVLVWIVLPTAKEQQSLLPSLLDIQGSRTTFVLLLFLAHNLTLFCIHQFRWHISFGGLGTGCPVESNLCFWNVNCFPL